MEFATSIFIATGLAMDAFAVSLGIGTTRRAEDFRSRFRLAFHFGLFQSLMTLLGWLAGRSISAFIANFDHWVACALLGYVGINMIRSGLSTGEETWRTNPSKGKTLVMLCVATSLDALAVGLSMAIVHSPIAFTTVVIGLVTLGLSAVGLGVGGKLGHRFGKRMEFLGGLILLAIGLRIVYVHLTG